VYTTDHFSGLKGEIGPICLCQCASVSGLLNYMSLDLHIWRAGLLVRLDVM